MQLLFPLLLAFLVFIRTRSAAAIPDKIYGVNLGSWLLLEPWMLPNEWVAMGGEICDNCLTCISSEFAFAKAYPDTVDERFAVHWSTWFTQDDVNNLKEVGINTVRIPLGYWIVEDLVNRTTESYPRGGIKFLSSGLKMLRDANINVILDHHALPGAQVANQTLAGCCTLDVQFYTPYNFGRALTWTAVMTILSHLHPNFESVFSIEAVNEPIMNAAKTPGYRKFQKNFVKTVRAVELLLGIPVEGNLPLPPMPSEADMCTRLVIACNTDSSGLFRPSSAVVRALMKACFILPGIIQELGWLPNYDSCHGCTALTTKPPQSNFMDVLWQLNHPANPAKAAIGPQAYDDHLYYSFGEVAKPDPNSYLQDICNRNDIQRDTALGNSPVWVGEWSLSTQFYATDDFLRQWADAQKLAYSQGAGWLFFNFKIETSGLERQWSYIEGVRRGYLTMDPSQVNDPNVCAAYKKNPPRQFD
ncbi:glycoside hydrolase family 5 protein [Lactifluus subvellereus]|nr:glycoside hydrolase family 5 protein [Lactifluus subvellereus]